MREGGGGAVAVEGPGGTVCSWVEGPVAVVVAVVAALVPWGS